MKVQKAAVGFKVKSGWATVVLLVGPAGEPSLIHHSRITLSDPKRPESRQPCHARRGTLEQDTGKLRKRIRIVKTETSSSVSRLLKEYQRDGYVVRKAGLVVGSLIDPKVIGNLHIRAHALEGKLFRESLGNALRRRGIRSRIIVERNAFQEASQVLRLSEGRIKEKLKMFADRPPWRGDEKLAALAAWIVL